MKIITILILSIMLCGCESKQCIKSHTEIKPMFLPSSNGSIKMIMMPQTVCDEWEG